MTPDPTVDSGVERFHRLGAAVTTDFVQGAAHAISFANNVRAGAVDRHRYTDAAHRAASEAAFHVRIGLDPRPDLVSHTFGWAGAAANELRHGLDPNDPV